MNLDEYKRERDIGEIDEAFIEVYDRLFTGGGYFPYGDGLIDHDGFRADIPDLGLSVRGATFLMKYEGEWQPDCGLTMIYDIEDPAPENFIYWETDDWPYEALGNYLREIPDCTFQFVFDEPEEVQEL